MAECKDIDRALADLGRKIDDQNKQIADLRKKQEECCGDNNNDNNDSSLAKRVAAIERYINALDSDIKKITTKGYEIIGYLQDILDDFSTFFEKIVEGFTSLAIIWSIQMSQYHHDPEQPI